MSKRNNGIHINFDKEKNYWEVREFIAGRRKRHAVGFGCREDAQRKLAEIILQKTTIKQCDTLGKVITYYIKEHLPTVKTPETALKCIERLIPFWAEIKLDDIRKSKSLEYLEYRKLEYEQWKKMYHFNSAKPLSGATVRREIEQLQAAINYAHRDNIINICPFVWKPNKSRPRTRWITTTEAAKILHAARRSMRASDHLPIYILIALYTGARPGAIFRLRWHQVDLVNGYIDFTDPNDSKIKKAAIVPISNKLLGHLKRHKKRGTDIGYVVHVNQKPIKSVKTALKKACIEAGVEVITAIVFRHTAASWRMQRGESAHKVGKMLGHTSSQMVEQVYGHLSPDHLRDVAER